MLRHKRSHAIVAVRDLDRARTFYRDTLGLPLRDEEMGVLTFATGDTLLMVYASEYAGTNRANAVVFSCGEDLRAIADQLRERNVRFLRYPDLDGVELRGDIHVAGDLELVWIEDPDGNILHLNSG